MRNDLAVVSLAAAAVALGACASKPENIQPSYVSTVPYESWSCQQLGEEQERLSLAYAAAAKQQNTARANDTAGVILLGLPLASMTGHNVAPEVARLKGLQDAVSRASILKNC